MMKYKFTYEETRIIVMSLIELKNQLIREGRYTDAIDELLLTISDLLKAPDINALPTHASKDHPSSKKCVVT